MIKGEGMTPDPNRVEDEDIKENVGDPKPENISQTEWDRGVVRKLGDVAKGAEGLSELMAELEAKDKNKGTADMEKPENTESTVLDEGAEDLRPIDVKNSEEERPVSKDREAIFIDAADLLQDGDLEGVQRMMDSYENDDGFKLELTKEMQRRLDAVKKAEAEDPSAKDIPESDDKPRKRLGGIAPEAKKELDDKLAEAAETMEKINEGSGDVETHDEVAPETSPKAEQKDEEQAETFEAPDDASSVVQLFDKLAEYKQRAKDIKAEAEAKGEKMPGINYTDAKYKEYVLSRVLDGGEYDVETLIEEYQETNDDSLNLQLFRSAVSVIQDYIETGGINVGFSTGLASSERLVEVLDGLENSSTPTEKWSESLQKAFKELRPDAERSADKQERDLKRVKGELDEDAKKAGGEAGGEETENARLDDDGGTPRGVEAPAESKEKDGETPPEPKDKVKWEDWRDDVSGRAEDGMEDLSEDEKLAYESLLAYAHGGELTEHAKEHIDLLRGSEGFDNLLQLMREASENGDNQEFQDALKVYFAPEAVASDERESVLRDMERRKIEMGLPENVYDEVRDYVISLLGAEHKDFPADIQRIERALALLGADDKKRLGEEMARLVIEGLTSEEGVSPESKRFFEQFSIEDSDVLSGWQKAGRIAGVAAAAPFSFMVASGAMITGPALRKTGQIAKWGRGKKWAVAGLFVAAIAGVGWLALKGAQKAMLYAYKRASKYTPPGLKVYFDKMIEPAQPSKSGGKSTGKK